MYDGLERDGWQTQKVRDWLLAIVRFAITLESVDRQTVLAVAQEMDGLGFLPGRSCFSYFVRTSTDLCRAIADRDDPGRTATLRRHLAAIADRRLRQTTAAAVDLEGARQAPVRGAIRKRERTVASRGARRASDASRSRPPWMSHSSPGRISSARFRCWCALRCA